RVRRPAAAIGAAAPRPRRQVAVAWLVAQLRHQRHAAAFGDQLRDVRIGVAEVAEMARAGRAGLHAGGNALGFVEVLVVYPVHAQRALLHHALDRRILARAVRAGPRTELAADALVLVDQHDAVLGALVAGAGGADGDASGGLAVQAAAREVEGDRRLRWRRVVAGGFRQFVAVHAVEPHAGRILAVGLFVGERPGDAAGVPFLAAGRAGMAADAGVEVDHQPHLLLRRRRQCGHGSVRWRSLPEP